MWGRLSENLLSAFSVCFLVGTIAMFSDKIAMPSADGASSLPISQLAASGVSLQQITGQARELVSSVSLGDPVMVMYALASLGLMGLMLKS
jgi:hypothetical protein